MNEDLHLQWVLVRDRQRSLLAEAERHRLLAHKPAEPGRLQRLALRIAASGRRPAVFAGRTVASLAS
jgi:hypothetical protein